MDKNAEQSSFNVQPAIEQQLFKDPVVQSFITKWCEINDSIKPQFISRDDWEQKQRTGILEKNSDGIQNLYIPKDLHLWEIVGVLEVIDYDTFTDKPLKREELRNKLLELGKTFQNAGTYLAQRLDSIEEGREIAETLAQEFYTYGKSIISGRRPEIPERVEDITSHQLTNSEIEEIDRFLAGDNLYKSRKSRTGKEEDAETERRKTLSQFFKVSAKAFELEAKSKNKELKKSKKGWQDNTPIHKVFITKIEKAMILKIETPERGLTTAILRRGLEKIVNEMKEYPLSPRENTLIETLSASLDLGPKNLAESLNIKQFKVELEDSRQTGNLPEIGLKEAAITDKIQEAVSSFHYRRDSFSPVKMVADQEINCVGASILGGKLMTEAGLNYLVCEVPGQPVHSILLLITSDGRVEWRDMQDASYNENIIDEMIVGRKSDGSLFTVADIVAYSKSTMPEELSFDIKNNKYQIHLNKIRLNGQYNGDRRCYVHAYKPEDGHKIQLLCWTGNFFIYWDRYKEALEAFNQAIILDPTNIWAFNGMGVAYLRLGRNKEALAAYGKAIEFGRDEYAPY